MNHRVQVFARGCLTLKLLGSWKTVTVSPLLVDVVFSSLPLDGLPPSGEIGIVSRGTGEDGLAWVAGGEATAAMVGMRWKA